MEKKSKTIHFVITGGTIDSFYDGAKDTVTVSKTSIIPNYINSLNLHEKTEFTVACMKDSRGLNIKNRKHILNIIENSSHKIIIITHGTYTMPDTGKYLKANLKRKDQTIVFTGSMIPISGFSPSDGSFNLGYSIAKAQELPPGLYVCMNGKIFDPDEVVKLLYEGKFVSVFSDK